MIVEAFDEKRGMRQLLKNISSAFIILAYNLPAWCDTEGLCCCTVSGLLLTLVFSLDTVTGSLCVGVHDGKLLFLWPGREAA